MMINPFPLMYDTLRDRCDSDNRTVTPLYSRWASLGLKSQMQAAEHALAWLEGFSVVGRIPWWGIVCIFIYICSFWHRSRQPLSVLHPICVLRLCPYSDIDCHDAWKLRETQKLVLVGAVAVTVLKDHMLVGPLKVHVWHEPHQALLQFITVLRPKNYAEAGKLIPERAGTEFQI